jgi:hypothetical protein
MVFRTFFAFILVAFVALDAEACGRGRRSCGSSGCAATACGSCSAGCGSCATCPATSGACPTCPSGTCPAPAAKTVLNGWHKQDAVFHYWYADGRIVGAYSSTTKNWYPRSNGEWQLPTSAPWATVPVRHQCGCGIGDFCECGPGCRCK